MMVLTRPQRRALFRLYQRARASDNPTRLTYRQFRKNVMPAVGSECIVVALWGMFIAIEHDGYIHS